MILIQAVFLGGWENIFLPAITILKEEDKRWLIYLKKVKCTEKK